MKSFAKWIPVSAALGAMLSAGTLLSPIAVSAQDALFADAPVRLGREILWSGRVDGGLAARVERVDVDHVALIVDGRERVLPLRGARVGVCVDASRTSTLMLTGKHGDVSEAVRIQRDDVLTVRLPTHAASAPHALTSRGECHWGIALVDGTLASIDARMELLQSPVLFERVPDLTEVGRGVTLVGVDGDEPVFVVSRAGRTSAWRTRDSAAETVELDALDPMIASATSTWSVDRAGALHVYTPFVGVREVVPSQGAATTGLLATQLAGQDVLAWATAQGGIFTWDGQRTQLRAQWDAEIRQPLLAVDAHGDASLGILATLENGSVGFVQGELAVPLDVGARSARAPMWVMTSSEAPACLAMTSTTGTRCFGLRELGPMGALGNGVTPMPGEVIAEGNSVPMRTHFEPIWGAFASPSAPGPVEAARLLPLEARPVSTTTAATELPSAVVSCSASTGTSRFTLGALCVTFVVARLRRRRR